MTSHRTVIELGRWRISVKFGRYRFGWRHPDAGVFSWGLGFCTGNAVRRTREHPMSKQRGLPEEER